MRLCDKSSNVLLWHGRLGKHLLIGQLFMETLHFKETGDTKVYSQKQIIHWQFYLCSFWYFTPVLSLKSNQTISHGDIAFPIFGGYIKCRHECSLCVNLVIDILLCSFRYFTSVSNFKAIDWLLMEILHLNDLGDTECPLESKAVVLVSHFNSNVPKWGIYPHIKFERDSLNMCLVIDKYSGSTGGRDAKGVISRYNLIINHRKRTGGVTILICTIDARHVPRYTCPLS